ncbi:MAG: hypothetical protein JW703_01185 [Candidatus Diapherotrites archaeon]|nr:hypothetical protein [Candidatus Diapherotrites archaeon]
MPRKSKINKDYSDSRKKQVLRTPERSISEKKWISFSNDLVKSEFNSLRNYLNLFEKYSFERSAKTNFKGLFQAAVDGASGLTNFKRNALNAGISEEKLMHVIELIQEYKKLIKAIRKKTNK